MSFAHFAAALALLVAYLVPAAAFADTKLLEGTVTYRERMALPPGATVEVELVDVSLADAPARTLVQIAVTPQGQVPVPWRLEYDPAQIMPGHSYALQARIAADGRLLFITAERHAVFTGDGPDRADIVVQRVNDAGSASPAGSWLAQEIDGGGVSDSVRTLLDIGADGSVSGRGGCNSMGGNATIEGGNIRFGRIVATQMACAPAAMEQEGKFFAALEEVRAWRLDGDRLELLDAGGAVILVLARQ